MAEAIGAETIAGHVSSDRIRTLLLDLGIQHLQGNWLAPPQRIEVFMDNMTTDMLAVH
ncbi:MAG: hypothetical protein R3E89_03020 [Thiolinea sp.]